MSVHMNGRVRWSNRWEAGALIGGVVGAVIGGELAMDRIHRQHSGAGGPEFLLVNGVFPGFVIGGIVGAIAGTQVHTGQ